MKLRDMKIGDSATVKGTLLRQDTARRLEMLGLTGGTTIKLLNKKGSGAVIVKLRGTRYAFGREIAEKVEVDENGK